jgi:hypothetical protein
LQSRNKKSDNSYPEAVLEIVGLKRTGKKEKKIFFKIRVYNIKKKKKKSGF